MTQDENTIKYLEDNIKHSQQLLDKLRAEQKPNRVVIESFFFAQHDHINPESNGYLIFSQDEWDKVKHFRKNPVKLTIERLD